VTAKKMLHGREFKISCGRFDRKISVEVDGKPAEKVDGALFRVALADGKYLQFRVEGSYMTGMNLIEGNVTLEVFRHISWYEYLFIFGPLLFLGFGAAFGLDAAEISNAAAVVGGVAGLVFALAGFFACNAVVHSCRLKKWLKILLNLLVLAALAGLFVWFFLSIAVVLALIGLGEALVNAAFLP